jgi:putative membrane protein
MRFLIRLLINTAALWVAVKLVPGITFTGTITSLILVALVFGIVNASIGLIVRILALPATILTLGLFALIVNGLLFWLAGAFSNALGLGYHVAGFLPAFIGAIVTSLTAIILSAVFRAASDPAPRPRPRAS